MHKVDQVNDWSKSDVLAFLGELLEGERALAKVLAIFAEETSEPGVASMLRGAELAHAAICITLWREIETRGGSASSRTGSCYERDRTQSGLKNLIRFATREPERLGRSIEKALPWIIEVSLHTCLSGIRDLHQRHSDRWKILFG
jgi:hypothetical protein